MKKIDLTGHSLSSLVVRNCPKLEEVDVNDNQIVKIDLSQIKLDPSSNNPVANGLINFYANNNTALDKINLENCEKLELIRLDNCGFIKTLKGGESFSASLKSINFDGTRGLSFAGTTYLKELKDTKEAAEEILGGNIPTKTDSSGKVVVDTDKLKGDLKDKGAENSPQKQQAEQEARNAKENLNSIGTELGLTGNDAENKDKIIDKIKDLKANQAVNNLLTEINNLGLGLTGNDITKDNM